MTLSLVALIEDLFIFIDPAWIVFGDLGDPALGPKEKLGENLLVLVGLFGFINDVLNVLPLAGAVRVFFVKRVSANALPLIETVLQNQDSATRDLISLGEVVELLFCGSNGRA